MKDKIIWILYQQCLYCSQIKEACISPTPEYITLYLNPIIGNINTICFEKEYDIDDYTAMGFIFQGDSLTAEIARISFDFDKLCSLMNYEKETKSS